MKWISCLLFLSSACLALARPYHGEIMAFRQPDGSWVDVRLFGDESYMRGEGLDGYTLIRDEQSQWICYAALSADQARLLPTGIVYKGVAADPGTWRQDLALDKHLDLSVQARDMILRKNKQALGMHAPDQTQRGTPIHPVQGEIRGLCLVIDFPDEPGDLPMSEFEAFFNDLNYTGFSNNGSIRSYFHDVSGGLVDYQNEVFGYFRAPLNYAHYDSLGFLFGAQQLLKMALESLRDQGFDFSTLSLNSDNSIQAINVMFTGHPKAWGTGMWHHQGVFYGFEHNGIKARAYNTSPANNPLYIGTTVHENGHMICKWPDTYKYDPSMGQNGLGSFDLMCEQGNSRNPVPPNPLFAWNAGWMRVVDVTDSTGLIADTANLNTCYLYRNKQNPQEFFLLQNRMRTGRSSHIPDEGLTIWHIDRAGDNQTLHHEVFLEHASNTLKLEDPFCFHQQYKNEFAIQTLPNSNFYPDVPSGLRAWEIGPRGNIIHYRLGDAQTGPVLQVLSDKLLDEGNGNGSPEAGESMRFRLLGRNGGASAGQHVVATCQPVGSNAAFAQMLHSEVLIGALPVGDSASVDFQFELAGDTPFGTVIDFVFSLSEGEDSVFLYRSITVGLSLNISDDAKTLCEAVYFDDGGEGDYLSSKHYVQRFSPEAAGQALRIHFEYFEVENTFGCIFDYLRIFDGPDTLSPLVGTYCGVNTVPDIVSSHASGSLCIEFRSNLGVNRKGWKALLSCEEISAINPGGMEQYILLYPNPTQGLFTIQNASAEPLDLRITDLYGKEIRPRQRLDQQGQFELLDQPKGMYLLQGKLGARIFVQKIILQ